jgi:hypothetical protein
MLKSNILRDRGPLALIACLAMGSSIGGLTACFGSSSNPGNAPAGDDTDASPVDGSVNTDAASNDASDATVGAPSDGGVDAMAASSDGGADGALGPCPASTCPAVKVVFHGWIAGADGGPQAVEIAVDEATGDAGPTPPVVRTTSANDPALGRQNLLVGDFITVDDAGTLASPLAYANDNNGCDVPDFAGRTNEYLLAPVEGLPIDPTWVSPSCGCGGQCGGACLDGGTGGACDFESAYYSQSCPNFGFNCVITPRKIESVDIVAANADSTCEVCFYGSTTANAASILRCASPGMTVTLAELQGGSAPLGLVRLDDGTSCHSY